MANEKNMIPCPYNCKQGAHPKGSRFCPFTGKPIQPEPPPVKPQPVPDTTPPKPLSPTGQHGPKQQEKKPLQPVQSQVNKNALIFAILMIIAAIVLYIFVFNGSSGSKDNSGTDSIDTDNSVDKNQVTPPADHNEPEPRDEKVKKTTYSYDQLSSQIKRHYQRQLDGLSWKTLTLNKKQNLTRNGSVNLRFDIDKNGKILNITYSTPNLRVTPQSKTPAIKSELKRMIDPKMINHDLTPWEENGKKINVTGFEWSVNIKENLKTLPIRRLNAATRAELQSQTRDAIQFPVNGDIHVQGHITFLLTIDDQGQISVQENSDFSSLEVVPIDGRSAVIEAATARITNRAFEPAVENDGTLLKVRNVPFTVIPRPVKVKEFKDMPARVIRLYNNQMNQLGEVPLNDNIQVSGQMLFRLRIDETGKVAIERSDNNQLQVTPQASKLMVTGRIIKQIQRLSLTPQTGENGEFLRVSNFPLTIKATMTGNALSLERLRGI